VVAEYDGIVASHIRDEGDMVAASVAEFINMLKKSGVKRGVVSHHKASNRSENWGKVHHTLKMIDDASADGLDVYCDVYPYSAFNTDLAAVFTPMEFRARTHEEHMAALDNAEEIENLRKWIINRYGSDDLSWVLTARIPGVPEFSGRYISDIAAELGTDHLGALVELWKRSDFSGYACFFATSEDDIATVLAHPKAMICTDSGSLINPQTVHHLRLRGSFPRVLGRYVREKGVTTLPEMIRKMTSLPAYVYGFETKGAIKEGFDADICIFDADKIIDNADYKDTAKRADGLNYVIVGGEVVAENSVYNGKRIGKVIKR
jgi:N-acyl-D-amino-acid deacylase